MQLEAWKCPRVALPTYQQAGPRASGPEGQYKGCGAPVPWRDSGLFRRSIFLDGHVFELARVKNVTALLALNEFGVFFPGHNAHPRMLTGFLHSSVWWKSLADRVNSDLGSYSDQATIWGRCSRIAGILSLSGRLSSAVW